VILLERRFSSPMTTEIFIMMIAFLFGGMTHCIGIDNKILPEAKKLRKMLYQGVIIYLLFRIGFKGGESILAESFEHVFFTSSIAVVSSVFWTVILLYILKWFSPFSRLTQISIATHFWICERWYVFGGNRIFIVHGNKSIRKCSGMACNNGTSSSFCGCYCTSHTIFETFPNTQKRYDVVDTHKCDFFGEYWGRGFYQTQSVISF
jgi:hypothetical protein